MTIMKQASAARVSVRDLICPSFKQSSADERPELQERRRGYRFACRMTGTADGEGGTLPVTCVNISTTGVRVNTPLGADIEPGQQWKLRFKRHARVFEDEASVVAVEPAGNHLAVHLAF